MTTHVEKFQNVHLSYAQFEHAIKQFAEQTRQHQPWSLVEYQTRKGAPSQLYLSRAEAVVGNEPRQTPTTVSSASDMELIQEIDGEGDVIIEDPDVALEDIEDVATAHQNHDAGEVLSASYHVVYSATYRVPVLYFNAYKPNGVAISVDEIFSRLVPEAWRTAVRDAGLSGGISQQDHPILNTPFYYLHPCETGTLMETLLKSQQGQPAASEPLTLSSYVRIWLSMTGQAIGLTLPPDLFLES